MYTGPMGLCFVDIIWIKKEHKIQVWSCELFFISTQTVFQDGVLHVVEMNAVFTLQ